MISLSLPAADEQSRQVVDRLVICTARYGIATRNIRMLNDINIGGVFIPGCWSLRSLAWPARCYSCRFSLSAGSTAVCLAPADWFLLYIVTFFLLLQGLTGVICMKSFLSLLTRYALTLSAVAVSYSGFHDVETYAQTPWTRDGRVRADVVQIAPDVSGPVISVAVRDNQWVNRGDVLYAIDPRWLNAGVAQRAG
jgi:hypothetical protein